MQDLSPMAGFLRAKLRGLAGTETAKCDTEATHTAVFRVYLNLSRKKINDNI